MSTRLGGSQKGVRKDYTPAYAYVPGEGPHPTRDPEGHSYGTSDDAPDPLAFEWGVDLYHHGYLWEAHEAWEPLWRATDGDDRAFLAGLIQCAAACLQLRCGQRRGAKRLSRRALDHLASVSGESIRGVDVRAFSERFADWMATDPESVDERPRLAVARVEQPRSPESSP